MTVIRTPDDRFKNLPGYDFQPHYLDLDGGEFGPLRMHYLDEGPAEGEIVVLLHGQGCWSYIFRKMIPTITDAGYRVICPDFIGFGRSDKLPDTENYTFNRHVGWLTQFLNRLELKGVAAYMFDWGGFFGLRIAAENPDIFDRIALSNTQLPTGNSPGAEWFINWRAEQFAMPKFPQGEMVNEGLRNKMAPDIIAAFDAPYPDESYKTGPRRFPMILPISPEMGGVAENLVAWDKLAEWNRPVLCLFSKDFEGTAMGPERLLKHIPGCRNQSHAMLEDAGFYIVEDQPAELARRVIEFAQQKKIIRRPAERSGAYGKKPGSDKQIINITTRAASQFRISYAAKVVRIIIRAQWCLIGRPPDSPALRSIAARHVYCRARSLLAAYAIKSA